MKQLVLAFLTALSVASLYGAERKPKLTPEQIAERKYRHFGGYVYQTLETKVVTITSSQSALPEEDLMAIASEMQSVLMLPVSVGATENVGVRLSVVDENGNAPLVVMPDNALVVVNVRALSVDKPTGDVLKSRVCKELWRGLIYALGGGNTFVQQCVMKQVSSLKDLDAIPTNTACPDAFMRIVESAKTLGIQPARRTTYRQACKEGWAPSPTNDVQKAIWDQVHQIPDKPITIEYDPKIDK